MNKKWIDEKLALLSSTLQDFNTSSARLHFEPTESIYQKLESGDERDLQEVVIEMSQHVQLSLIPSVSYEWGLKMELDTAGQLKYGDQIRHIQIPFYYLGKQYALGAILAHELAHALLFSHRFVLSNINENEMFTDIAAVYIGFGKLLLNGLVAPINGQWTEVNTLGYLPPDLIFYSYQMINRARAISVETAIKNLLPGVKEIMIPSDEDSAQ